MFVKFLKAIDDFEVGQTYEVDDEDGAAYIKTKQAEAVEVEDIEEVDDVAAAIRDGLGEAVKTAVADAFKSLKSPGAPPAIEVGTDRKALDPKGGFKSIGQFLKQVQLASLPNSPMPKEMGEWVAAVKTAGHMAEGDDSQGGFLVPTEFLAELQMNKILETGLAARCRSIPMATNSISIPCVNETTHATSVYGGVIVYRTGEAGQKTASKPTFGLCTLTLHKLTAFTYVSDELLEDSVISIAPLIGTMFPDALRFTLEDDIINGTGAGMGLGIIPAPATSTVARAAKGAIARAAVLNTYRRMYAR